MNQFIIALFGFMSICSTSFADSVKWENQKAGDVVTILEIQPGENLKIETRFIPLINNSLELKINDTVAYLVSIEGTNSYNRNFLKAAKSNLESDLVLLKEECKSGSMSVIGELNQWNSSIFGDDDILVVYPLSLQVICNDTK